MKLKLFVAITLGLVLTGCGEKEEAIEVFHTMACNDPTMTCWQCFIGSIICHDEGKKVTADNV